MSRPVVGSFAEELYAKMAPFTFDDERQDWPLLTFIGAIGTMFQPVVDLVRDTDDGPGWSQLMDLNRTSAEGLGWLAQFIGVSLRDGLSDADQRVRVAATDGFRRGAATALAAVLPPYLTGTKTILINERAGDPYQLDIVTYASETPDPVAAGKALGEQKPGGILLNYYVTTGSSYAAVHTAYGTYADLPPAFTDYADLRDNGP